MINTKLVGLDCGETSTGVVVITESGIGSGYNISNDCVIQFIKKESKSAKKLLVIVEDVRPYNMRITNGIINTIKFIGETEWRLKSSGIIYELIPRWKVKQWVFKKYNAMVIPEIIKKIDYARKRKEAIGETVNSKKQNPSFVYIDDRLVQKAMRKLWNIPIPKVGHTAAYGLKDHSWQALGLISCFLYTSDTFIWPGISLCKPHGLSTFPKP
jgi:hypothetical protein